MNNASKRSWLWLPLATGFGLGYSPVASGTFGTLPGLLLVWGIDSFTAGSAWRIPAQIVIALALTLLAIPICGGAESIFGKKDDGRIVADEYMTFPVCMIGLPLHPAMLATAFVTNRIMDILKPPPANQAQSLKGGLGIVADDFFATLYSLAVNHLLFWLFLKRMIFT